MEGWMVNVLVDDIKDKLKLQINESENLWRRGRG